MQRNLRRFIQLDKRKLEENEKKKEEEEKKADYFVIVHTEDEFNEKCRNAQNPSEMKNVHFLIQDKNNQNQFKWQMSSGPVSNLKKYLLMNTECEEFIDEAEIFHKNNEKILIVSAEPGMGKSLILDHFTQNSTADNFFLKIILNTCTKSLKELKNNQKPNDWIEFVLKSLLNKTDQQEILLLKHLAKEEKLILMFDGLDEVIDYKEQVIQLIDALNNNCRFKKILITTRNHLREELEDHFRTFSFNLNNFNDEDQKNFLIKYWRNLSSNKEMNDEKLKQSATILIKETKSLSSQNLNELIGIPLQTKMLADIFFGRDLSSIKITNIADMYNEFIESKIEIQVEKANNFKIAQLSKPVQKLLKNLRTDFYSDHTELSSLILFEQKNKDEVNSAWANNDKIQEILEYGVIVAFTNGVPTFLHQSFAEFFLAKSCLQKMKEQNKTDDMELKQILREERHFLIRKFLNDLMQNQRKIKHQVDYKNKYEDLNKEIENCCRENLLYLLKYFIQDRGADLKTENKFLIIASKHGHKEIVAYLIEKGIDVNQQVSSGPTALIWASKNGHTEILEMLLKVKNIEINQHDWEGCTALIQASKEGCKEIVEILLKDKYIDFNKPNMYGITALMCSSQCGHAEIVGMLLKKENIQINKRDLKYGYTALLLASENGHKTIFQMLLKNGDLKINDCNNFGNTTLMVALKEGHKEMVKMLLEYENIEINQQNKVGSTALMLASKYGHTEIVEILLQKDYIQINQQDNDGNSALIYASLRGNREIVELLLKRGILNQQNKDGLTALIAASKQGHLEIVQMLLKSKNEQINQEDKKGNTALIFAAIEDHKDIVQILLQNEKIQINHQDKKGNTALIFAAIEDHKDIVQILLQNEKIQINHQDKYGYTAFMWATGKGHKEIVQMFEEKNKDKKNVYGNLALIWASRQGHKEVVEMLLQEKIIKVNQKDEEGKTALMRACMNGHTEIVQMLLQSKDNEINHKDKNGKTALIWASEQRHKEIVLMLLQEKNININQQDNQGNTALIEASWRGNKEIVQILLKGKN
jgi:ankyrin repeat protein